MRLSAGPLTRAGVDQCYNIVYGTSSTSSSSVGSPPHMGPTGNVAPTPYQNTNISSPKERSHIHHSRQYYGIIIGDTPV